MLTLGPLVYPPSPESLRAGLPGLPSSPRRPSPSEPQFNEAQSQSPLLLTPAQIAQAKQSPLDFAEVCSGGWYHRAPHLELLNRKLLDCAERNVTRLMVFMPPRHSKSETISHFLCDWWLGTRPDENIILASYGQEWADHWGREARNTLNEYGQVVFGITVSDDSSAAGRWQVDGHRGGYKAAGIGGALTGRGADLFIIDDPVKNAEEAWSATIQQRNIEWWRSVARTRLEPNAVVIVIMTRWHTADLAGVIMAESKEPWIVLELPAVAHDVDEMGRQEGEALWPARYPYEALMATRAEVGEYYWQAEYQQRPVLPEGLLYFDKQAIESGVRNAPEAREKVDIAALPGTPAQGYALVWERPVTGERYYIGADTADGKGEVLGTWSSTGGPDRNAAAVYRVRDSVQVAELYGRWEEHVYARILDEWGRAYNLALLGVERNRRSVLMALRERGYPNLYYTVSPIDMHVQAVSPELAEKRREYGFDTNAKTRPTLLSDFREAVTSGTIRPMSKALFEEMQVFVLGDPPQAAPGQHDDRIFAHAIALQVRKAVASQSGGAGMYLMPRR